MVRGNDRRVAPRLWLALALAAAFGGRRLPAAPSADGLAAALAAEDRAALATDVDRRGDAARGATVFHTRHLTCTQCHVAGAGVSPLGPNLAAMPEGVPPSQLTSHLLEALLEPSAVIRPAFRGVTVITADGRSRSGIVARESADELVLRDAATGGREISIPTATIEERVEQPQSLMPHGLPNLLTDRRQFLDLVRYLREIAVGGADRAAALPPDPAVLAGEQPAAYEAEIDHAGFLADWRDPKKSRAALKRGEAIYGRVCGNCHGTLEQPGSLPTAPRFAEGSFKHGSDPHAMYRTLTAGNGLMVAQRWMVPSQKYDVIHYIRETFLKDRNRAWYTAVTPAYVAGLPPGTSRGPEPTLAEPWRTHDYGPFLAGTFEVGETGTNVARKGLAVRLDDGGGGVARGTAWVLYELDTLRMAAFWTGDRFIDWVGINFDGRHGRHPHVAGDVQAELATMPGWADPTTGSFADPRPLGRDAAAYGPLPRDRGRFRAVHHVAIGEVAAETRSAVVLEYLVGSTPVLETARLAAPLGPATARVPVVIRSFSIGPRPRPLTARLAATPAAATVVGPPAGGDAATGPRVVSAAGFIDLVIPAGDAPLDVAVAVAAVDPAALAAHAATLAAGMPPRQLVGRAAPAIWPTVVETSTVRGGDDGPFAVDVLSPPTANPWDAQVRFSGLDFTGPDEAVLCTWDGDVWLVSGIAAPDGRLAWRRIASGLFQPLGIRLIGGAIHVGCRDRIVRLVDLDGDRLTDRYDTFNDDHQVTEHFHEFAMGLETDAAGNVYYAKSGRHALPAVVPHHGTLLEVAADGSATTIVATGFRAANGVCVEPDGSFWVTDQEGHWNPKNRINHVVPGGFYGNMLGYHDITDPSDDAMEPPAFWITNAFDRSPAELVRVTSPSWTPLVGGLLELSYGEGRVHLVLTEPVGRARDRDRVQGGMVALPLPADLPTGVMRGRFHAADGQLYACGLFAWAGNRTEPGGLFRIRRTSRPCHIPVTLHAEPGSLVLGFPEPLDRGAAADLAVWTVTTWGLKRTSRYGSDHVDETVRAVAAVELSSDGRQVVLRVPDFAPTWCYSVAWRIAAADGTPVRGLLHGTLH